MSNYKVEAVKELAEQIKQAGYRVFLAESGTYGLYTDKEGTRVVCFQYDLGGFRFSGNYITDQPRYTGTGWVLETNSFEHMFYQGPLLSQVGNASWKYTTLEQHLNRYNPSSKYTEQV